MPDEAVARKLLAVVARRYSELQSLSVDMALITDIEEQGYRHEQRSRGTYAAPDKVRTEQGSGKRAVISVTDGKVQHHYMGPAEGRYMKNPVDGRRRHSLGFFNPEYALNSAPLFLFHRIAERVTEARMVRDEAAVRVVAVTYAPPDATPGYYAPSPVHFWIDPRTNLVMRMEGELALRSPIEEDVRRSRITSTYSYAAVDEPVAADAFEFTPPPGAREASAQSGSGFVSAGGGSSASSGVDPKTGNRYEMRESDQMEPDGTLVRRGKIKINDAEVAIERRLKLSADRREIRIVERITGSDGQNRQFEVTVPVVKPAG